MQTRVIDVSRFQGDIDFKKVKAAGVSGVIIKAGVTGWGAAHTKSKDAKFETNYKNAKAAGLNVGAYYYSGAMTETFAVNEAKYFLSLIKGKEFDLPVYMDVEETHSPTNMPSLGKTKLTAIVSKWCATVEAAGYFVGFYTAKSWCDTYLDMKKLARYTFWLAHWTKKTDYKGEYGMWQYTEKGSVAGISGNVDLDYCYKDFPTIIKSAGLNGYKKVPEKTYTVSVTKLTKDKADKAVTALKNAGFAAAIKEEKT